MATKNDARELAAQMRAEQGRRERRRRNLKFGGGVTAVLLVVGGLTWIGLHGRSAQSAGPIVGLQTYTGLGRNHVTGAVVYPQTPPVGGNHSAVWQNCGWYGTSVHNENAVHSLEHSAVWITYSPTLSVTDKATLKSEVSGRSYVLASAYNGLPAPVVASAWGAQVKLTGVKDPRLAQFIKDYAGAASAPEPGGECSGGLGTPSK